MDEQLPEGTEIEVEFISDRKPNQKGFVEELDFADKGFVFQQFEVVEPRSLRDSFTWKRVRKWVNFDVVAEVRFLPPGTIAADLEYHRELHRRLQEGLREREA
jgi:hypothetical protein